MTYKFILLKSFDKLQNKSNHTTHTVSSYSFSQQYWIDKIKLGFYRFIPRK